MDALINNDRAIPIDSMTVLQLTAGNGNINRPQAFPTQSQGHAWSAQDASLTQAQGMQCSLEDHLRVEISTLLDRLQIADVFIEKVSLAEAAAVPDGLGIILDLLIESRTTPKTKDLKS